MIGLPIALQIILVSPLEFCCCTVARLLTVPEKVRHYYLNSFCCFVLFILEELYLEWRFYPFMAVTAIWRFEVITHTAICLTLVDKYFKASQHSMCLS